MTRDKLRSSTLKDRTIVGGFTDLARKRLDDDIYWSLQPLIFDIKLEGDAADWDPRAEVRSSALSLSF